MKKEAGRLNGSGRDTFTLYEADLQIYVRTLKQIQNYANRHTDVHIKHIQICSHTRSFINNMLKSHFVVFL